MEKPKIRFKSFEKRWESYRLSEYSNYRRGSFPQPYGNKEWYGGDNAMPFVQVVDVLENLRLVSDTKQKISTLAQPMSVFVPSDSVIVTLQGSIGRVAITQYDAYVDRTILIFEDYIYQTNKEFWAYTIRNKFEIERQKAPGGTIKTITKEALSDFKVSIPNYSEQSAIGSLFRTLDDLLASYKDNLANYQSLKATMLSKMFPKAGQTVPEIRLDGFEGEWKIKRADEIFKSVSEKNRALLPVLSASQIDGMVLRDEIGIDIKYDEATLNNYKVVKPGQFVIHLRSFQGGFALSKLEGITSPAYTIIDFIDKENHLPGFWNSILTSKEFIKRLETVTYGIRDGKSISFKDFSSLKFVFPNLEEQQAIGSYFSNLDNLINTYQEKISKLETLKKKLLQDMFI